jgi:hypothetical protein
MAEIAAFLPKWQALQILCQTMCQYDSEEVFTNRFFLIFFLLTYRYLWYNQSITRGEMKMRKFGTVQIGFGFECEKNNGKTYAGEIVKVAAYARGTLVTIRFADSLENDGRIYSIGEMPVIHKSIYLEDCKVWFTEAPSLV